MKKVLKCPACGSKRVSEAVYDGGNGEGARIRTIWLVCEDCREVTTVSSRTLPAK
jgi:formate dehydrogenase maturation protein FdhE